MVEDQRFPCPACGADLTFDPGSGDLVCGFCGHREATVGAPVAGPALREIDFARAMADGLGGADSAETRVSHCPNCGADITLSPQIHATVCPFCATPFVGHTGVERRIKPQGVLPFRVTEAEARKALTDWLHGLWFAPNALRRFARKGRAMTGVYLPFWTFDARTRARYRGARGHVETRSYTDGDGRHRTRTVTRWFPASGEVSRVFDDVLVSGSGTLPDAAHAGLAPWDLAALAPYSPSYIAGFQAEAYAVGPEPARDTAMAMMERAIHANIRRDIGGDRQRIDHVAFQARDVTFKHVLLPVWLAVYTFRGRMFRVALNGQSGRVTGERPYSWIKIGLAALLALIVAGIAYYTGQQS